MTGDPLLDAFEQVFGRPARPAEHFADHADPPDDVDPDDDEQDAAADRYFDPRM